MSDAIDDTAVDRTLVIKGHFPLPQFIRFVRERCAPRDVDEASLVSQWHDARMVVRTKAREEAGIADRVEIRQLPEEMAAAAEQVLRQASMQRLANLVPRRWCLVEIDNVVVFQEAINLRHIAHLRVSLPAAPRSSDIIDLAARSGSYSHPAVRSIKSDDGYIFSSESNDLRFLDVVTVDPATIQGYQPFGAASHAIVLYLGFSDNVISATRAAKRIFLTNGSHRAYALRELGFTHVPCLLTEAADEDAFDLLLPADVKQDRQTFLFSSRPPLFRDYFDPRVTSIIPAVRRHHVLQAKLDLQKMAIPAL